MKIASFLSKPFSNIECSLYEKKNAIYYFQTSLFQRDSSFKNMQICQLMTSYTPPNFDQIWWRKDISTNIYQKCLILCSKILLNVLHDTSLTVLFPWQHTGFQTSPIFKFFLATFGILFWYLLMVPRSSLWPCLMFFQLKISNILKSSGWGLEKNELPWEPNFL